MFSEYSEIKLETQKKIRRKCPNVLKFSNIQGQGGIRGLNGNGKYNKKNTEENLAIYF